MKIIDLRQIFLKFLTHPNQNQILTVTTQHKHICNNYKFNKRDEIQNQSLITERMSKEEQIKILDKELDLSNAGRGVWLVKVPKYIANKWEKAPGNIDVGKLRISKFPGQKAQVSLSLSDAVINLDPTEKIPKEHRLDVSVVTKQTLGVFSHMCKMICFQNIR